MKLPSIRQLLRDSVGTLVRYPYVLLSGGCATVAGVILLDYDGPPGPTVLFNILFASILGLPLFFALAVIAEKKGWGRRQSLAINVVGLLLLVAYACTVPSALADAPDYHILRLILFFVGLHFFVAFAPFQGNGEINGFWHYNETLFFRFLTAFLYSTLFYAGFSLALAAIDHLFGIEVPGKRYGELWIVICGLFNTWFFLAGIPEDLKSLDSSTDYPRSLKIFAQYILSPLALVYLAILYAYVVKILFAWDWPQGWVSGLILGFSAVGILTILLLYPIRDREGNGWIRLLSRWFYVLMVPLVVLLPLAVLRRISQYGITEGRYVAAVLGIWLIGVVLYFLLSARKNIKVLPLSLCVFSFLASFGPWGMFDASERSQVGRLRELLTRDSILVDGSVRKARGAVPYEEAKQISSILSYLHDVHGYARIQHWFSECLRRDSLDPVSESKGPDVVAGMMGVEYVRVWPGSRGNEVMLNADREGVIDIEGYDRFIPAQHLARGGTKKDLPGGEISYRVSWDLFTVTVVAKREGRPVDSLHIELRQCVERLRTEYAGASVGNIPSEKLSVSAANSGMKVKVYLLNVRGRWQDSKLELINCTAEILYTINEVK